jgi:hypothetical protein
MALTILTVKKTVMKILRAISETSGASKATPPVILNLMGIDLHPVRLTKMETKTTLHPPSSLLELDPMETIITSSHTLTLVTTMEIHSI